MWVELGGLSWVGWVGWVGLGGLVWVGWVGGLGWFRWVELGSAQIKKLKRTDPHLKKKKLGSLFFNFLIRALLRPQIAMRHCATISCVNF